MDFKNERLMMSEEEVRNRAKELLNENQVDLITKYMFLEQQCKKLKERIEYLERSNNRREDTIIEQRQEISDLEDNWIKLKEYIKTEIPEDAFIDTEWFVSILDKMQELEKQLEEINKKERINNVVRKDW